MQKILVANRGEIALRVMKTLKKMSIKTVAVFSEADRLAPHVLFADEAYPIGPAPSSQSYLRIDKILEVAAHAGCDGIHPGYGFLSENADFAEACKEAGVTFIGPDPHAIRVMGSKIESKQVLRSYEVPMVPGTDEAIPSVEKAQEIAKKTGFPLLIKASAGGGGKGMRIVHNPAELPDQFAMAKSEALSSFGNDAVFIEKFVTKPRHIEIQILADQHGNVAHLFERECSIQRRHQKVVEEAPSSVLSPELRHRMGQAAIEVAKACDYVGAGTVEFLLDAEHNFYFLEMNTRLQVEHPVTECISGLDLVEQQVHIARGQKLSREVLDAQIDGHAIELRVYAEDPMENFSPSVGFLSTYREPSTSLARTDSGIREGMEIPIHYDPMISKLIVHAPTRAQAVAKMLEAIQAYEIEGCETTLEFGRFVMNHEAFLSGDFDTSFIAKYFDPEKYKEQFEVEYQAASLVAAFLHQERTGK